MNQLTKEEVARVFAMYMTTLCQRVYTNTSLSSGEDDTIKCSPDILKIILSDTIRTWSYKLLLTPLSKITDEHLRMVLEKWKFSKVAITQIMADTSKLRADNKTIDNLFSNIPYHIADQLREWGYMLPYKGIDLFEAGIAIDKTVNQ